MSTDTYTTRRPSCLRRIFGTVTAFVLAGAVVYLGSYLVIFDVFGLPTRNQSGWLGAPLRFLQTGPLMERGEANFYRGDTGPYKVFKPLNTAWLRTKALPVVPVRPPGEDADAIGGDRGESAASPSDEATTTSERRRRGGRRGSAAEARTTAAEDRITTNTE